MKRLNFIFGVLLALFSCVTLIGNSAHASWGGQPPAASPARVSVLTMGPGDHPFSRFGHTALLLEWQNHARVYNFGTFVFEGRRGVQDFLQGRFRYWLSVSTLRDTLASYRAEKRTVVAQDLNLTAQERKQLYAALEENARPENRYYDYDYFKDNCTTRVRDALDAALGGELRLFFQGAMGEQTFREHMARLAVEDLGLYIALDAALGRLTDVLTTRFDELWIPDALEEGLDRVRIERSGKLQPLVSKTRVLAHAERAAPRASPPNTTHTFLFFGLLSGAALATLGKISTGHLGRRELSEGQRAMAQRALGVFTALIGLACGLVGIVLLGFSLTKHWAAHQNWNILLLAPWSVLLVVTGARLVTTGARGAQPTRRVLLTCVFAAAAGALLPLLPPFHQDNLRLAGLMVPLWTGLWWGARTMTKVDKLGERKGRA